MIFTSYFANIRHIQAGTGDQIKMFSIARSTPKAINIEEYPDLFPTSLLLSKYKADRIDVSEYEREYRKDVLNEIDADKCKCNLVNSILLCYEKPADFCHRRIIRKWLAKNGRLAIEWQERYKIAIAVKTNYTYASVADYNNAVSLVLGSFYRFQQIDIVSDQLSESLVHRILPNRDIDVDVKSYADDMWADADMGIVLWRKGNEDAEKAIRMAERHHKIALIYDYGNHRFSVRNFERVGGNGGGNGDMSVDAGNRTLFG